MEKDPLLHRPQTRQRDAAGLLVRGVKATAQANRRQLWQAHRAQPQYAHAAVRHPPCSLREQGDTTRVTACLTSSSSPPFGLHLAKWPPVLLPGCMGAPCGPGRGQTPVCRPHITEPGDHFHPFCANLRSPGPQPARWRVPAAGRHQPDD